MAKKNTHARATTDAQIELYNTVFPLLKALFTEIKDFSKKSQNEPMNLGKVKMTNRLLFKAKEVLANEPSIEYLDLLEEEDLPSISDAVLTVSQYISALEKFHSDHYYYDNNIGYGWDNEGHWN